MDNSQTNLAEKSVLGQRLIQSAILIDESLAELLKLEIKEMKKLAKNDSSGALEELSKINNLIRTIIIALTITDDKIRSGLDLCREKGKK